MRQKVYLAARYSRREEMMGYAADIRAAGHECCARWVEGVHDGVAPAICAADDWLDIERCDVFVLFCEAPSAGYMSGGRHVELGFALAFQDCAQSRPARWRTKETWIVGDPENVFHHLPEIDRFASWQDALAEFGDVLMLEKLRKIEVDLDLICATRHAANCGAFDDDVQVLHLPRLETYRS